MSDKKHNDANDAVDSKQSAPLFVKYVGGAVNGIMLPAFGDKDFLPGEFHPVRGPIGFPFLTAFNLVQNGQFGWCDGRGADLDYVPQPTADEIAHMNDADPSALVALGITAPRAYADFDTVRPDYEGPDVGHIDVELARAGAGSSAMQAVIAQTVKDNEGETEAGTPVKIEVPKPDALNPAATPALIAHPESRRETMQMTDTAALPAAPGILSPAGEPVAATVVPTPSGTVAVDDSGGDAGDKDGDAAGGDTGTKKTKK